MKKIADIIHYIEENLNEPISVESVAAAAGYSRFHFQRLFAHCVGVNVGYYINQRRLVKAAEALATTDMRIIDISCMVCFESQEAFTRAFKKIFNKTPAQYRRERNYPILKAFPEFDKNIVSHISRHKELTQPRFVDHPARAMIGYTAEVWRGTEENKISQAWASLHERKRSILNKKNEIDGICPTYGVLLLGAKASEDNMNYARFLYSAAVEVEAGTKPPEGADYFEIEAQRYAVFDHRGGMSTLPLANKYIWGVWLPQNKIQATGSPDIEYYPHSFRPKVNEAMELWVPIQKED